MKNTNFVYSSRLSSKDSAFNIHSTLLIITAMLSIGLFKWYNPAREFGVLSAIIPPNNEPCDVFFHHSNWSDNTPYIPFQKPIVFELGEDKLKHRHQALNCRVFDSSIESWHLVFDNDHKAYSLIVHTDSGTKTLLQECIRIIKQPHQASNFILTISEWFEAHPETIGTVLNDILLGGKRVTIPEFQDYLKSFFKSNSDALAFEIRRDWLNKGLVGLYAFSNEECLQLFPSIQLSRISNEDLKRLSSIVYPFNLDYKECIDDSFMDAFCKKEVVSLILQNIDSSSENSLLLPLFETYINNTKNYEKALDYTLYISADAKVCVENLLINQLSTDSYLTLLEKGICQTLPDGFLDSYFDDNENKYSKVNEWVNHRIISQEYVKETLKRTLSKVNGIKDYKCFRTVYYIYNYSKAKHWENEFAPLIDPIWKDLINWSLNPVFTSYDSICNSFILFPELVQIKLLKFLFLCIAQGRLTIQVNDLQKLNYCCQDYLNNTLQHKPVMSASVSIVIQSLISYAEKQFFINDIAYYGIINSYINNNHTIAPIGGFFDKCPGKSRLFPPDSDYDRFIYPIIGTDNIRWYIINFVYDQQLKELVKQLPGCRWHPRRKVWFAPESSLADIESFARSNSFILFNKDIPLDYIGQPLSVIKRFFTSIEYLRAARPASEIVKGIEGNAPGIRWCEGCESQTEPEVWWCVGHWPCYKCSIRPHSQNEWEDYTLLDFCIILGLCISESNDLGSFSYGAYARFIRTINKHNQLLERLICRDCGKVLYSANNNYSVSGGTQYCCKNSDCKEYNKRIYISHCYTGLCRGIVDSRDLKRCPNGLLICSSCGMCCSTEMFIQRRERLWAATDSTSYTIEQLTDRIQNDEGHINHKNPQLPDKFFCYNCGSELEGLPSKGTDIINTKCNKCGTNIKYDISLIHKPKYNNR